MSRLLIIGCGGVASVAVHKCCQNSEVFTEIMIASRTVSKCEALKAELEGKTSTKITTAKVDADNVDELAALMESYKPDAVLNLALPYQDLTIMSTTLTPPTMSPRTRTIRSGGPFMKNAVRKRASQHILTIPGSGHIKRDSRRPA